LVRYRIGQRRSPAVEAVGHLVQKRRQVIGPNKGNNTRPGEHKKQHNQRSQNPDRG